MVFLNFWILSLTRGTSFISTQHIEGWFTGRRDCRLYWQQWLPSGDIRAVIILVHGLFEHSGRYASFAEYFVSRGFAVYSYDHRGHGQSAGLRGYVERFGDFISDLSSFAQKVSMENPKKPIFLFGHSIGGTISAAFAAGQTMPVAGVVFSAPVAKPGSSVTRSSIFLARILSFIAPRLGVTPIDGAAISRDLNVVQSYAEDSLVYRGKIRARLGAELINVIEKSLPGQYSQITVPVLILHGSADTLSNIDGSRLLYQSVGTADKTIKIYDGFYHEVLNEPDKICVFKDIEEWLNAHLSVEKSNSPSSQV